MRPLEKNSIFQTLSASKNKQSANMENRSFISKGVVITVYVESPRTRSIKPSEDPRNKTKPHPSFRKPQITRSQSSLGYDRRAHLLAYSRKLRENAQSQKNVQVQLPHNHSRPRSKASSLFSSLATSWFSSNAKNIWEINGCHQILAEAVIVG